MKRLTFAVLVMSALAVIPAAAGPSGEEKCCHFGYGVGLSALHISGGQYLAVHHHTGFYFPQPGLLVGDVPEVARYIGTPHGPPIDTGQTPERYRWSAVMNGDPVTHTLTECVDACGTSSPVPGTSFSVTIGPAGTALVYLPPGTRSFMCTIHPWMRGEVVAH